jgi:Na+-driven multidrug efflux pump
MHITFRGFRPDRRLIGEIYQIGLPAILIQSLSSVMSFGLNYILKLFSATGVIVAGIYFKVQSFVCMPVFGLFNGLTPIVSYNYGARKKRRLIDTIHFALVLAPSVMAVGALIVVFGAPVIVSVGFDAAEETLRQGVPALRMVAPSFVMAGFSLMFSASFQALGRSGYSLVLSLLRQLVLILPLAALICQWNPELVWLAFPLTEGVAALVAAGLFRKVKREVIDPMPDEEEPA